MLVFNQFRKDAGLELDFNAYNTNNIIRNVSDCQRMMYELKLGYQLSKEDKQYYNSLKTNRPNVISYTPQVERNYNAYQDWLDKRKK